MKNIIFKSRIVELLFATGIPLVAFLSCIDNVHQIKRLIIVYPLLLLVGWHIIAVNDICFGRKSFKFRNLINPFIFIPVASVPLILILLFSSMPAFITVLFLIILNWNTYSLFGKYNWISGLSHNFIAGFLHYFAGATGADSQNYEFHIPMALFFAFGMTCGAIHHDSCDCAEDSMNSYKTGAVRFGAEKWWKLGIIPLIAAQCFLISAPKSFIICFIAPSIIYILAYSYVLIKGVRERMIAFRIFSRTIFAAGGLSYGILIIMKFFK